MDDHIKNLFENSVKYISELQSTLNKGYNQIKISNAYRVDSFDIDSIEKKLGLYRFFFKDKENPEKLLKPFEKAKFESKTSLKFPKYNEDTENLSFYDLYIGISTSGKLKSRVREHIEGCSASTYALRLNEWMPKKYRDLLYVEFYTFQDLPDGLSEKEKVIFLRELERNLHNSQQGKRPMIGQL